MKNRNYKILKFLLPIYFVGILGGLQFNLSAQTTITLPELLQTRFSAAVTATTYEECRVLPCDNPDCNPGDSGNQDDIFSNGFYYTADEISRSIEVQCEPGDTLATGVEQVIDLSNLHLPNTLYRIRLCGGVEGYVLGDDRLAQFEDYGPY